MYGDPILAASLMAGMPYPAYSSSIRPQIPLIGPSMQQTAIATPGPYSNCNGGYRYAPYGVPSRNGSAIAAAAAGMFVKNDPNQHGSASPLSTLSLSSTGSDQLASPIVSDIHNGLLMHIDGVGNDHNGRSYHSTTLEQTPFVDAEKPKLFQPYKE